MESPEDLRSQPIILDEINKDEWEIIAVHILKNLKVWKSIESGEDKRIKENARPKAEAVYAKLFSRDYRYWSEEEKQNLSIFGQKGGSCPAPATQGAFNTLLNNALQTENSFPCPKCNTAIPSGLGITKCPHCGITKETYGSTCD